MTALNLKDIQFPMTLSQFKKFENLNISIDVQLREAKRNDDSSFMVHQFEEGQARQFALRAGSEQ